jgi:hypothetical protein
LPKKIDLNIIGQSVSACVLLGVAVLLFVSWDTSGRNSFELLGVIHRLNLLPGYIPTRPILMLWVLLPLFLFWGIKGIVQNIFRRFDGGRPQPSPIWLLLSLISCALISYVVTLAPTATDAPSWCLWLSLVGIFNGFLGFLPRRN